MKTVDLTKEQPTVADLLRSARTESVLVKASDGENFVLSLADDFTAEVELLRKNHAFLTFLDDCKREQRTVSLEEAERRLR